MSGAAAEPRQAARVLPSFFLLGATKAGTTSLHAHLAQHPRLGMSEPKEPHFYDLHYARGLDWYADAHFAHCSAKAAVGDATPAYLALPFVAPRVRAYHPEAKLVAILRHPAERLHAQWWMLAAGGLERRPFADVARSEVRRWDAEPRVPDAEAEARWRAFSAGRQAGSPHPFLLEFGHYAEHIARWHAHYPRERLLVLLTEDLERDAQGTTQRVWDFLGVGPGPSFDAARRNTAPGAPVARLRRTARDHPALRAAWHRLPRGWRDRAVTRMSEVGVKPAMPADARRVLLDHYRPHNERLARL
ncbi:MAG: sulfotransferase domain-containing protein, partial [Halobacteriales archaeon]|nr:sulfotransferase domain-containing protein [Halobacteriales archaeon]